MALCLVAALLATPLAGARGMSDLHRATVPVADRGEAAFGRAAALALEQVLVKLTGRRDVASVPGVPALLADAKRLMVQYAYREAAADNGLELFAEFDEAALSRELRRLGIGLWVKERPDTVAWLVVDAGPERELVGGDEPGRLGEVLVERARARGVPLLLPLMDIEESQHLSYAGDWEGLKAVASALSGRYGAPAVLIGHLRQEGPGLWEARWSVQLGPERFEVSQDGDIPELLVEDGVDALADALARRFAGGAQAADRITIAVLGVDSAGEYARVSGYLSSLDAVTGVLVSSLEPQAVRFELSARGGREALAERISFGQVLAPVVGRADTYRVLR